MIHRNPDGWVNISKYQPSGWSNLKYNPRARASPQSTSGSPATSRPCPHHLLSKYAECGRCEILIMSPRGARIRYPLSTSTNPSRLCGITIPESWGGWWYPIAYGPRGQLWLLPCTRSTPRIPWYISSRSPLIGDSWLWPSPWIFLERTGRFTWEIITCYQRHGYGSLYCLALLW